MRSARSRRSSNSTATSRSASPPPSLCSLSRRLARAASSVLVMLDARWLFVACAIIVAGGLAPSPGRPTVTIAATDDRAVAVRAAHLSGPVTIAVVPDAPHIGVIDEYDDASFARG